jgi:hypothetical protein
MEELARDAVFREKFRTPRGFRSLSPSKSGHPAHQSAGKGARVGVKWVEGVLKV